jgi:hypothetical protein
MRRAWRWFREFMGFVPDPPPSRIRRTYIDRRR